MRICCQNRLCSLCSTKFVIAFCLGKHMDSRLDFLHRKLFSDHSGRAYQHLFFLNPEYFCRCLCCLFTILHPFFSGTRICNSRIDNYRLHRSALFDNLLIPLYRSCLHHICRKSSRRHTRNTAVNQCHVCTPLVFDLGRCRCRLKSRYHCNSTFDLLHLCFPSFLCCLLFLPSID